MLADASSSPTSLGEEGRSLKKRRVGGRVVMKGAQDELVVQQSAASETAGDTEGEARKLLKSQQQTAYDDSGDSDGSDLAWEEIDLQDRLKDEESTPEPQELNLVLGAPDNSSTKISLQRRKPLTSEERKLRLDVHKMHLLSLLAHVYLRNYWCNDAEVQKALGKLLPKKTLAYLDDDESQSQFQRSRSCMDGLEQASDIFRSRFKITARGMSRSYWAEDAEHLAQVGTGSSSFLRLAYTTVQAMGPFQCQIPSDIDLPTQKSDFRTTAKTLQASRDIGAQLFCALLRSAGVEARLVCSLQPLPFTAAAKGATPLKPRPSIRVSYPDTRIGISDEESGADAGSDSSVRTAASTTTNGSVSRIRSKLATGLGRSQPAAPDSRLSTSSRPAPTPKRKPIRESPYPIYWVEAFNVAVQKWVPVDPLVTKSIAKFSKFEPPASDTDNSMTYVIAFEDDGSARDVTRRYAKAYNAKTRKARVEITKGGEKWWRRILRIYQRVFDQDRDQVEDAEMSRKEEAEGMPRNVQDFKNHPYYALERHLRRNEVVHPKREVGKVAVGRPSADGRKALEPVFRRRDVHMVKSADSWYRLGREIKTGEQPLKRVQPRQKRQIVSDGEASEDNENAGTAMYAAFQTKVYVSPPVVRGIIPKNSFGNLDVYVPSMVPPGAVHISHQDTARAARLIGVDYADAVTGFEFKGRFGTAVVRGAVVAREYQEAVEEVIRGFEHERIEAEESRRSLEALRMWKRLLTGLRIRERIEGYEIEGEQDAVREQMRHVEEDMDEDEGGGFLHDRNADEIAEPTASRTFEALPNYDDDEGGGFVDESLDEGDQEVKKDSEEPVARHTLVTAELARALGSAKSFFEENKDNGNGDEDAEEAMHDIETKIDGEAAYRDEAAHAAAHLPDSEIIDANARMENNRESLSQLSNFGHGLAEYELEEAKVLQQIYESQSKDTMSDPRDNGKEDNAVEALPTLERSLSQAASNDMDEVEQTHFPETGKAFASPEPESKVGQVQLPDTANTPEPESEADKGSLLSEDPSDEDAEPEWISQFQAE
ncbi:hypothetical protein MMC13_006502 [Lambiella insularis]|nr:hypothetical protein [Lambiella insularis]